MAARLIGMIGLGVMGSDMAAKLIKAGFKAVGYDPLPDCRARHRRAGGTVCESALEVARSTRILITSLPSVEALAGVAKEISGQKLKGVIIIETSTLPIPVKQAARKRLAAASVTLLDCPLSGTGAQARTKDLVVYASGPRAAIRRCVPVFRGFARAHHDLGKFGNGSKMKFAANLLVAIHNVSAAGAVVLARRSGLNAALAVRVLGGGAGGSRMLHVGGPMMAKGRYTPATMSNKLWQKDMQIIGEFVRQLKSPAPLFSATKAIYNAALAQGRARQDTAAVCAVLERAGRKR